MLGDLRVDMESSMVIVMLPVSGTLVSRLGNIEFNSDIVSVIVGLRGPLDVPEGKRNLLASDFLRRASLAKLSISAWYLRICNPSWPARAQLP